MNNDKQRLERLGTGHLAKQFYVEDLFLRAPILMPSSSRKAACEIPLSQD